MQKLRPDIIFLITSFHGSVHSGVRRNEIQTSSATAQHGTQIIVATTYFLSIRLPTWRGTNCCMVRSSENNTQLEPNGDDVWRSPVSFYSPMVCGFSAGPWDFSPNSLVRRLETMLVLIT